MAVSRCVPYSRHCRDISWVTEHSVDTRSSCCLSGMGNESSCKDEFGSAGSISDNTRHVGGDLKSSWVG